MNSNISNISENDTLTAPAPSMGSVALDNAIYISDKAKQNRSTSEFDESSFRSLANDCDLTG